jgi:hypothetical protein
MDATDNRWHLDKKVPISIIVVLVMQAASGLWLLADMRRDIDVLKVQYAQQRDRDEKQDEQFAQAMTLVRTEMRSISDKLDRLIERNQNKP